MPLCSPARLAANQQNARKSTGPKTAEGKQASRGNALRHGLAAEVLHTPAEVEAVAAIPLDRWREREAAVLAARIERAHRVEDEERADAALRAETCWDADRARAADRVALGLDQHPDRVVLRLRATPHGCDWLLTRWRWLEAAAKRPGGWDAEQTTLALHLKGIPTAFHADPAETPDPAAEIAALEATRATLQPSDALRRRTTQNGLNDHATPELRRAIRYTTSLFRRLRWCLDATEATLTAPEPVEPAPIDPTPAPSPMPTPAPAPEPTPAPPPRRIRHLKGDTNLGEVNAQFLGHYDLPPLLTDRNERAIVPISITPSRR